MKIISQQGSFFTFDVIVLGSGIAGLSYVLELLKLHPTARIALITKANLSESNTYYAQGGIAAVYQNTEDSLQYHTADTLAAGDALCNVDAVEYIISQGANSIEYLLSQGVPFDYDQNAKLACGMEGGHSKARIYHSGDQTGAAIVSALLKTLKSYPQISIFEEHTAINLITQIQSDVNEVIGAYIFDEKSNLIHTFFSKVLVLATGGAGRVYRYTSNPSIATGDGLAMAYRAGAAVADLEFYQFHPTLLYHPKINNFLISEALRGEGAYLRSADTGERFMKKFFPEKMELATRDIIARAIFCELEHSNYDYVYLDIRHKDKKYLSQRFPMITKTLEELGLDLSKDLIPVVPAAHYMCGGIVTDISGRTSLARLYAIGEVACSGLHGANRLASNSLLEGVVVGRNAAHASQLALLNEVKIVQKIPEWDSSCVVDSRRASQIHAHWRSLRGEMTSYAGIIRTEQGLQDQLQLILARKAMVEEYYWRYSISRDLIELRNIILVAELIVRAALARKESRGGHFREDYPNKNA